MALKRLIHRHRTALVRTDLSRPVRQALADAVLQPGYTVFDFGCGLGGDVQRLTDAGFECAGWDPVHRPQGEKRVADVVNLGYVVNVIERPEERSETLQAAWSFAQRVLIVSARLKDEAKGLSCETFEDGGLTRTGTFQKFYDQSELREWVHQALGVGPVAAAPGVFYVFREESEREAFVAQRYRRRVTAPKLRRSDVLFEQHRAILEPLMSFVSERGRLPADDELELATALRAAMGTVRSAFRVAQRVTGEEQWEHVRLQRTEDLLVYVGLSRFDRRPRMSNLSRQMQLDVKGLFGAYTKACAEADEVLFALGQTDLVEAAMYGSPVGKVTPNALYVHESTVSQLPTLLRMYEGCARAYVGAVEGANLIKLHRESAQVSYLSYPAFEKDPHPALASAVLVDLRSFRIGTRDYRSAKNPPVLHRKELFVGPDHQLRKKFASLTAQEEKAGLLGETASIGTRDGWAAALKARGLRTRGHRLVVAPR